MAKKPEKIIKSSEDAAIYKKEEGQVGYTQIESPSRNQLLQELSSGKCTLFFYKKTTGSFRKMRCTLAEQQPVPSKYNREDVIVVWDLDANQWRSFYPHLVFRLIRNEQTDVE